jgi:hypothetical protein
MLSADDAADEESSCKTRVAFEPPLSAEELVVFQLPEIVSGRAATLPVLLGVVQPPSLSSIGH